MATPRFTLPDPARAQAPSLPPELLTHILKLAQAGKSPTEQLKIRLNFEKVSKAWFMCDFRWRVVALKDFSSAEKLLGAFDSILAAEAAPAGSSSGAADGASAGGEAMAARVRTVYLRTSKAQVGDKTTKLAKLFSLMKNVTSVEIFIDDEGLGKSRDVLDDGITTALAGLGKVKHFKLVGPYFDIDHTGQRCMSDALIRLAPRFGQLETLDISNCTVGIALDKDQLLTPSASFKSLELSRCGPQLSRFGLIINALPSTTRELTIDDDLAFLRDLPVGELSEDGLALAKRLETVVLTGGHEPAPAKWGDCPRGLMQNFADNLEDVKHLVINPCAINNLSSLADLKKLTQLEILSGLNLPESRPAMGEFVELFERSKSLKAATAEIALTRTWEYEHVVEVERVARAERIAFTWVDEYGEDAFAEFDDVDAVEDGMLLEFLGMCPGCGGVH